MNERAGSAAKSAAETCAATPEAEAPLSSACQEETNAALADAKAPHSSPPGAEASLADSEASPASPPHGEADEASPDAGAPRASSPQTETHAPLAAAKATLAALPQEEKELAILRGLLFSREIALLDELKRRLDDPQMHAKDVSAVIAEAMILRTGSGDKDERLDKAFEPLVQDIFKSSLRKHPVEFAGAIFPVMGPAIRRSIAESFRGMLEGMSRSLEMSFSWKGLRWRLEGLRTGKSFSEIVLLRTLVYRVDQIFFIHSETGLVLSHMVNEGVDTQDADMVSAMLTAIQDFARDCFASGNKAELETLQLGDLSIILEKGPEAYLACVVRGTPPPEFRQKLRATLEIMLLECADALPAFNGDTAPFVMPSRHMGDCLVARFVDENKPLPWWGKALPVVFAVALLGGIGFWQYTAYQEQSREAAELAAAKERAAIELADQKALERRMNAGVAHLRREPGIFVVSVHANQQLPWELICLKDEFARLPEDVLTEQGFTPGYFTVRSEPFLSYTQEIVIRRVKARIQPPATVSVLLDPDGRLSLAGEAPIDWILSAQQEAKNIPGVKSLDVKKLNDPKAELLFALVREIENARVEFRVDKDVPAPEFQATLVKTADDLAALEKLARTMGIAVNLIIYGHSDTTGQEKYNYDLSQARAKVLAAMLYARGSSIPVAVYGMGSEYADRQAAGKSDQSSRRIELKVRLSHAAASVPDLLK